MQKRDNPKLIYLLALFLSILCGFFYLFHRDFAENIRMDADNGILDLRESVLPEDRLIRIEGQWVYLPKKVLTPLQIEEDFAGTKNNVSIPHLWSSDDTKESKYGYATYGLKIRLPERDYFISLLLGQVHTSYKLWINGKPAGGLGKVSTSKETAKIGGFARNRVVLIKPDVNEISVVLQLSNYNHAEGGIKEGIQLGRSDIMTMANTNATMKDSMIIGSFVIIAIYHFALVILFRYQRSVLYFGLLSLIFSIRFACYGDSQVFLQLFPGIDYGLFRKIEYISLYLTVFLTIKFVSLSWPKELSYLHKYSWLFYVLLCAVVLFTPSYIFTETLVYFHSLTLIVGVLIVVGIYRAALHGREGALVFSVGVVIFTAAVINDILLYFGFVSTFQSLPMGLLILILVKAISQSEILMGAFFQLEKTKKRLKQLAEELEAKIAERTRDLVARSESLAETNRELEKSNLLFVTSYEKLSELHENNSKILDRINTLSVKNLDQLDSLLDDILKIGGPSTPMVESALIELEKIRAVVDPMMEMYLHQQTVSRKKVFVAEKDVKHQGIIKLALGASGVDLTLVTSEKEGLDLITKTEYEVVCITDDFLKLGEYGYSLNPKARFVLMTSKKGFDYINTLREFPFLTNIIYRDIDDRDFMLKNILITISKIINNDIFGLEKYLSWGVEPLEIKVVQSDMRRNYLRQVSDYLAKLGLRMATREKAVLIAEELMMNAIYDAPKDDDGREKYNHLPRTEKIYLPPLEQATLKCAYDGILLGISVEDPFGSLNQSTVLDYLERCTDQKMVLDISIDGKGGAGLGLFQIVSCSDLVVINVKEKIRTEFIALLNTRRKRRIGLRPKPFHYFLDKKEVVFSEEKPNFVHVEKE